MTTATLGFAIDSRPASSAAVDLEKLTAAAVKTEQSVESLEVSAKGLGTALGQAGQGAQKALPPVEQVGRAFQQQDEHVRAFRMELDRLTAKYQPLAQASKNYEASVGEINRAHQLGVISAQQMQKALDAERMAYERLRTAASGAGQAVQAANQNSSANRANAINAGYQAQDIVVSALSGQSAGLIGFQQGTQLAAIAAQMERPVQGLAAAFASMLNPISLVTIGLTAGTAALIQYFSTSSEGSDGMSEDLREQAELIARVAERWGDATPKLQAFADEMVRAAEANERLAAGNAAAAEQFKPIVDVLGSINEQYTAAIRNLRGYGAEAAPIVQALSTSFSTLQTNIMEGKATTDNLKAAQDALAQAVDAAGTPAIHRFRDAFAGLVPQIEAAIKAAEGFRQEAGGSILPTLGGLSELFSEGGRFYTPEDFIPKGNIPIPGRRPLWELEGPGGQTEAPTIINSDGKLVNVPVPGQRPNYFEREADMPAFSRANRNTYWDRSVLQEEMRRQEMGEMFKGFFTDFGAALRENGGDLGKALMESLSNAMMNAASQAWDKLANTLANALVNAVMGPPSTGLMNKSIGFTGANTTLGQILGAGGGVGANDNVAGGFSGLASAGGMSAYRGAISAIESGGNYRAMGPITRNGDRAYGKYQMMGNNIGPWSQEALGRSLSADEFLANPGFQDQIFDHKFGSYVNKYGPSGAAQAWFGGPGSVGKGGGAADILGTTGTEYVEKFNNALGGATDNLGTFGGSLGKLGQSLTGAFPAAPAAPGGGGGGIFGWLGGLFGGGGGGGNLQKYVGLTGLFADGTNYAPGGMAIVGERGPELVNLPQGSQVFSNHKSMDMMRGANNNQAVAPPKYDIHIYGGSGDDHIRSLVHQGIASAEAERNDTMRRGQFGDMQRRYGNQKG